MPTALDPSLNRRKLRLALRSARDKAGLTQRDAAEALEWSLSKIIRIEAGTVSLSVTDLRAMLREYGVSDQETVSELEEAARGSKGQSWWSEYSDVMTPVFTQFLGYESAATLIRAYHPSLVPGLLQTTDYATALFEISPMDARRMQRTLDMRLARQERVLQDGGPKVEVILDEAALRRQIGGPATMRQQVSHIKELASGEQVTVYILPFTAGAHDSLESSFFLLSFQDEEDALYLVGPGGTLTNRDDREVIARYQECYEDLRNKALSETDTIALLDELVEFHHTRS